MFGRILVFQVPYMQNLYSNHIFGLLDGFYMPFMTLMNVYFYWMNPICFTLLWNKTLFCCVTRYPNVILNWII